MSARLPRVRAPASLRLARILALVAFALSSREANALAAKRRARHESGAPRAQLVWNDGERAWSRIDVRAGGTRRKIALTFGRDDGASPLRFAHDARPAIGDFDGDGTVDVALWSHSERLAAFWLSWATKRDAAPLTFRLGRASGSPSTGLEVSWGYPARATDDAADNAAVVVIRERRLDQLVFTGRRGYAEGLALRDLTFDDWPDLVVPLGPCSGNCWVDVWPFDPQSKRFVASASLADLSNVEIIDRARRRIESFESNGEGGAVHRSRLLEITGTEARVIAEAIQNDDAPGSLAKRLTVRHIARNGRAKVTCEALVDAAAVGGWKRISGTCTGWPLQGPRRD